MARLQSVPAFGVKVVADYLLFKGVFKLLVLAWEFWFNVELDGLQLALHFGYW